MNPNEVFVPGKFPIEKNNIYADRGSPQHSVRSAIDRGFVPLVFGGYGVGKSSMVMHCLEKERLSGRLIYIETMYKKNLKDIFQQLLEKFGYTIDKKTDSNENESGSEVGVSAEAGILWSIKAVLSGKIFRKQRRGSQLTKELIVTSPTDRKIMELCENKQIVLVIDELHRANEIAINDLSAFVRAYANQQNKFFKIVLIGTGQDASRMVYSDPGNDRALQEIGLKSMIADESRLLLTQGFDKLRLTYSEGIIEKIISTSVGVPFVLQYIGLEMAEMAQRNNRSEISLIEFESAMKNYASNKAQRLVKTYKLAIETVGEKKYRKQILHAMSKIDDEYITMEQIASEVSRRMEDNIPSTTLSGPLRDLKSDQYGGVLTNISTAYGGRAHNYHAFKDPAMKSIIRMIDEGTIEKYL